MNSVTSGVLSMILIKFMDKIYPTPFDIINAPSNINIYKVYTPCQRCLYTHTLWAIKKKKQTIKTTNSKIE